MKLGAMVLAAGRSQRFGRQNKLFHRVEGEPLLAKVLEAFEGLDLMEALVVTGHEADRIESLVEPLGWRTVFNSSYEEGMGTSLACGARMLQASGLDGVLLCLGDLPGLKRSDVAAVMKVFVESGGNVIVQPRFAGRHGHPVCFPNRCFAELAKLSGDQGARNLLAVEGERLAFVEMEDDGCVRDLDTV